MLKFEITAQEANDLTIKRKESDEFLTKIFIKIKEEAQKGQMSVYFNAVEPNRFITDTLKDHGFKWTIDGDVHKDKTIDLLVNWDLDNN